MVTFAISAIQFKCEHCGEIQFAEDFAEDSLDYRKYEDRVVKGDRIDCKYCGKTNTVLMEF